MATGLLLRCLARTRSLEISLLHSTFLSLTLSHPARTSLRLELGRERRLERRGRAKATICCVTNNHLKKVSDGDLIIFHPCSHPLCWIKAPEVHQHPKIINTIVTNACSHQWSRCNALRTQSSGCPILEALECNAGIGGQTST